jgi:hypothetical protein
VAKVLSKKTKLIGIAPQKIGQDGGGYRVDSLSTKSSAAVDDSASCHSEGSFCELGWLLSGGI